jgi:methylthioribulose-1-phosphate dehydratase
MVPDTESLQTVAESLCATARWCYTQGWVPATSGNFSVRLNGRILITASGLDKGTLTTAGLLEVDGSGHVLSGAGRPSAETGLHLVLYRARPQAGAILHVHTVWNTLISARHAPRGYVPIEGYELLKGLSGVTSHAYIERVPILENSQDYEDLATQLEMALEAHPHAHGVLLSRHGGFILGDNRWPRHGATWRPWSFSLRSKRDGCWAANARHWLQERFPTSSTTSLRG